MARGDGQLHAAALPGDLEVAVRVNVRLLASEWGRALAQKFLLDVLLGADDVRASELLDQALARSELLWLGFRAGGPVDAAEKVLILRGHFAEVRGKWAAAESIWAPSTPELGRPHFFRDSAARGSFVRVYPQGDELLLWATAAHVTSVERWLERGADGAGLRPPERGAMSAAARPERLRELYLRRYPQLAAHFSGARQFQAHLDTRARWLTFELELSFETSAQALSANRVLETLRLELANNPCALGSMARAARVSAFERSVRVLARLEPDKVGGLESCVLAGECCV